MTLHGAAGLEARHPAGGGGDRLRGRARGLVIRALTRDYKPGTAKSVTIVSLFFGDTFFGILMNSPNFDAAICEECMAHETVTKKRYRKNGFTKI